MLNGNASTPLYVQLIEDIKNKIVDGTYSVGHRLPSEGELAEEYGVSIITVRKAIGNLKEEGLIERIQGKGTFITKPKMKRGNSNFAGFSEICIEQGVRPGGKMLNNEIVKLDEQTAHKLEQSTGSQAIYLRRLRLADDEPVAIENIHFPLRYAFLLEQHFDNESLFQYLKQKADITIAKMEKSIELCRATAEEAKLLKVAKGAPLLLIKSVAYLKNGKVLYAERQLINGDRFIYHFTQGEIN